MRGALTAALLLVGLQAVVTSAQASGRVGGALEAAGKVASYVLDPTVPGIPDLAGVGP